MAFRSWRKPTRSLRWAVAALAVLYAGFWLLGWGGRGLFMDRMRGGWSRRAAAAVDSPGSVESAASADSAADDMVVLGTPSIRVTNGEVVVTARIQNTGLVNAHVLLKCELFGDHRLVGTAEAPFDVVTGRTADFVQSFPVSDGDKAPYYASISFESLPPKERSGHASR